MDDVAADYPNRKHEVILDNLNTHKKNDEQLKAHIDAFIKTYNKSAEPFIWTKSKVQQRRVKGRRLSDL